MSSTETQAVDLERLGQEWAAAELRGDTAFLGSALTDDFVGQWLSRRTRASRRRSWGYARAGAWRQMRVCLETRASSRELPCTRASVVCRERRRTTPRPTTEAPIERPTDIIATSVVAAAIWGPPPPLHFLLAGR